MELIDPGSDVALSDVPQSTWLAAKNLCAKIEINYDRFKSQLFEFRIAVRRTWTDETRRQCVKNLIRFIRLETNFQHLTGYVDAGGIRVPGKPDLLTYIAGVIAVSISNGPLESIFNGVTRRKTNLSSQLGDDKSFAIEVVCEIPTLDHDPKTLIEIFGSGDICTDLSV
jgi:hypothetical protein